MASIEQIYPTGRGFSQVVVASGSRHIFLAGQCAFDRQGRIVGKSDLAAQTEQIMQNIAAGLEAAGAGFADLVRMTIYVVDYTSEKRDIMQAVRDRYIDRDGGPASTLIGVAALVHEDLMVEVEVQALV
ncbi:MAG: RidA family protein [Pseudomonadota bacterium]